MMLYIFLNAMLFMHWGRPVASSELSESPQGSSVWYHIAGSDVGNQHSSLQRSDSEVLQKADKTSRQYPGSRAGSATWNDNHGNVFLFGGIGLDHQPTEEAHLMNDLWIMNSTTMEWTPMFRILQPEPSPAKVEKTGHRSLPQPRQGASACGVEGLVFVVFGGEGTNGVPLYDTWIYSQRSSSWIALYIHRGEKKDAITHPTARAWAVTWCAGDKMILFGGVGTQGAVLKDMWEFSLRTLTWKALTQNVDLLRLTTTQSTSGKLYPLARSSAVGWVRERGAVLYMLGGIRQFDSLISPTVEQSNIPAASLFSDFWMYFPRNESWIQLDPGQGVDPASPTPGPICCAVPWTDNKESFLWLYGGYNTPVSHSTSNSETYQTTNIGHSLWSFNISNKSWSKSQIVNATRTPVGVSDGNNPNPEAPPPASRMTSVAAAASWTSQGAKCLFGGLGEDGRGRVSYLNQFWVLVTPGSALPTALQPTFGQRSSTFSVYRMTPLMTFMVCLATFGGLVMVVGTAFCLKKFLWDYPRHTPGREYNVKYSPIQDEATLDFDSM